MSDLRYIVVAAGRGGTGKSTLTVALAHVLAERKYEVAVLDLDPQATAGEMVRQKAVDNPTEAPPMQVHGFEFFRSGRALALVPDDALAAHIERAGQGGADRIVVVDMPPALHDRAHRMLLARDDAFVLGAIQSAPASLSSLNQLAQLAKDAGRPYMLVPTMWAKGRNYVSATDMVMRQLHPGRVTDVTLPVDSKAAEAPGTGMPATLHARRSPYARAVVALAAEVFGLPEQPTAAPKAARPAAAGAAAAAHSA